MSWQEEVCLHGTKLVTWAYGDEAMKEMGGYSKRTGEQTVVLLDSIIVCKGKIITESSG